MITRRKILSNLGIGLLASLGGLPLLSAQQTESALRPLHMLPELTGTVENGVRAFSLQLQQGSSDFVTIGKPRQSVSTAITSGPPSGYIATKPSPCRCRIN